MKYILFLLLVGCLSAGFGATHARAFDLAASTQDELAMLQFFGGGKALSDTQQHQATQALADYEKQDPLKADLTLAKLAKLAAGIRKSDARRSAGIRERGRYIYAVPFDNSEPGLKPVYDVEKAIIDENDPLIVLDTAHKGVISRHTVDLMVEADGLGAPLLGVAAPASLKSETLAASLKDRFTSFPAPTQDALSHFERNAPNGIPWLRGLKEPERQKFLDENKAELSSATSTADGALALTDVIAKAGLNGTAYWDAAVKEMMMSSFNHSSQRMMDLSNQRFIGTAGGY